MTDFEGRTAVVTGAAGNLGSAVAGAFLRARASVALVDKRAASLEAIVSLPSDSRARYYGEVNLTDLDQVIELGDKIETDLGPVEYLLNIAGGFRSGNPVHETAPDTWQFMMDLNARTVFNTAHAFLPGMRKRGSGKIVSVAARPGLEGRAGSAAYAASKSAVLRLSEAMSKENKALGINVNCVIPGTLDTPQNREAMPDSDFEKWVDPQSLARVMLFLCSPEADEIHGIALPVYGLT